MKRRDDLKLAVIMSVVAVIIMSAVERYIVSGYLVKSIIKVIVFGGVIIIYSRITDIKLTEVLNIRKNLPDRRLIILMLFAYIFIISGYFVFRDELDLNMIRNSLFAKEHLTRDNFYLVFLYIIIFNSFLEECFFRGFVFSAFKQRRMIIVGYLFQSFLFAVYHVGIISTWFSPFIFILIIMGLMGAGILLQFAEEKNNNLLASYLVHGFANMAINTIGTIMILAS